MLKRIEFDGKKLLPNAMPAPQFQKTGKAWEPQVHFTGALVDSAEVSFVTALIRKHATHVAAYYLFPDRNDPQPVGAFFRGMFSLELQFAETTAGQEALDQCLKEYRKGKRKRQRHGFDEAPLHKRLQRSRFYLLPDGREFLYLGEWDRHGNLLGKVLVRWNEDGTCDLANVIVPRETLARCELLRRDDEPFTFSP